MTSYKFVDVGNMPAMRWELDESALINVNGQAIKAVDFWKQAGKDTAEPVQVLLTMTLETPAARKNRLIAEKKKQAAEDARWAPVKKILDEMAAARDLEWQIKRRINTPAEVKNDPQSE